MSFASRFPRRKKFLPLLQARKRFRQLSGEQQAYVVSLAAEKWSVSGYDVEHAKAAAERQVNADAVEYGFDPATIMLLLQLIWLIYQLLVHFELLSTATPEIVAEMLDTEVADYE
jgi:hypothetical protein